MLFKVIFLVQQLLLCREIFEFLYHSPGALADDLVKGIYIRFHLQNGLDNHPEPFKILYCFPHIIIYHILKMKAISFF